MNMSARNYIDYAKHLSSDGRYDEAVDFYFKAFRNCPGLKRAFEQSFTADMIKLTSVLVAANKIDDLFSNFRLASEMFPNNVYLMNELGKCLYKYGYYAEAWSKFRTALNIDAGYVSAEKNLNSLKNLMVERWHFRMLNDKTRNDGYRAALHEAIEPGATTVLDLGTGTGLLAMYATECNPKAVTACDGSEVMCELANYILKDNDLVSQIKVVNKMSTSMTVSDLAGQLQASLLVTELFDAGLFGEHILKALSHAWQNLLSNSATVIPNGAEFFILGAHSSMLRAKYQLHRYTKELLNVQELNVHVSLGEETYDCEDVHLYEDIKYITDAGKLIAVDFMNVKDIEDKQDCCEPYSVELKALETGEINVFIGWFNLHLTPNITITTDPRNKNRANAWQQAVFFDSPPQRLVENETLKADFLLNTGKLTKKMDSDSEILRISPETLKFLNDTFYIEMIKNCSAMAYVHFRQMNEISALKVVDFSPFPVFGFIMLKKCSTIHSVTCCARTEEDSKFIKTVIRANDIPLSKITVLVGDSWSTEDLGDQKYHAIFCNIFELGGDIDMRFKDIAKTLRAKHLIQGGLFIPSSATLIAQIVSSNWLNTNNRVYNDNVGYKISRHLNKYQVSQHFCLDYANLEYIPLSNPIILGDCFNLSPDVLNVMIRNDGDANAILCWYCIVLIEHAEEISTKRSHSFIDGTAFLANPTIPMVKGEIANILSCVDSDGAYKLILDLEST